MLADRVWETSTSIGTGNFALGGAKFRYRTFVAGVPGGVGGYCAYTIENSATGEWEMGRGLLYSAAVLQRVEVYSNSNGNTSFVDFGTGTKDVFISPSAKNLSLTYTHTQASSSATWTITHNLNKKPSVTIVDSAGTVVYGNVTYTNDNVLVVTFSAAFSGYAYLN